MKTRKPLDTEWPVLTRYDQNHLLRIALPLGGIGTGTVSLGGFGDLRDWEIMNRPAKGFYPSTSDRSTPFFALYAKRKGAPAITRALQGPLPEEQYEGSSGAVTPNHGLPRFRHCKFEAAYPLGQVVLSDPEVPLSVRLQAFNPFIPADADASGIPVAVMRYVLTNSTSQPIEAAVCGMLPNFIGNDGFITGPMKGNRNEFRRGKGLHGVYLHSTELDPKREQWGTLALSVLGQRDSAVSYRTAWAQRGWGESFLDFWEDFAADGRLDDREQGSTPDPKASLAARVTVPARGSKSVTFLITWHFPNRQKWFTTQQPAPDRPAVPRSRTPFVRTASVSPLLPFDGDMAALTAPAQLALETRTFSGDLCDRHVEISAQAPKDVVAFYQCRIECPEPMKLDALLGYDGPVALWVDGQKLFTDSTGTNPAEPAEAWIPFEASKGQHDIRVALGSNKGKAWGIFLQFERTDLSQRARRDKGASVVLPRILDQPAPAATGCGCGEGSCEENNSWVGNYYATQYRDAWDVAEKVAARLPSLESQTVKFVRAFCDSDLPVVVKDAALATLTGLRSQTTFRTADGFPFGWEGCGDHCGCCQGSCTHVWNYENGVGFLFGDFSRLMRQVEFEYATNDLGLMCFRVGLPLKKQAHEWAKAAADGQLGAIMRFYRDWKLSGDEAFLKSLWPKVRKTLEFCWIEGGWDADRDGVMEGCQHNTMDVEYFGPNPQMGIWYLGALRAVEEMARHVGEMEFSGTCRKLFERGRDWMEANLFNGEFYEHQIWPPKGPVAEGLLIGMGAKDLSKPGFQLGAGCLVDQLVGQYMAHAVGLGYLIDPGHARTTLRHVMKYNFRKDFYSHFNHMRSYVLNDESALLMATYPHGNRPESAFPYYSEVMTGFEYTAAVGMLYEGMTADGLKCIKAIRDRYDGKKRSPFNEAECGHHYARAMASWTAVLALTGFQYDGTAQVMEFAASKKPVTHFWSNGYAWGTCRIKPMAAAATVELTVLHGTLTLKKFVVAGKGTIDFKKPRTFKAGKGIAFATR